MARPPARCAMPSAQHSWAYGVFVQRCCTLEGFGVDCNLLNPLLGMFQCPKWGGLEGWSVDAAWVLCIWGGGGSRPREVATPSHQKGTQQKFVESTISAVQCYACATKRCGSRHFTQCR